MASKTLVITSREEEQDLRSLVPQKLFELAQRDGQKAIPNIAKDTEAVQSIDAAIKNVPSSHRLVLGDSRAMEEIPDKSVHLVATSPPYWTLKEYPMSDGQLGRVEDYESFLMGLDRVWEQVFRVLVPGGRLVIVVGDVCLPRRSFGRHVVYPLHASIQEHCRRLGFDNLAPIIWHKIANASFESSRCTNFLGKPYEPNAIIKNDIEYILFQRKPGGYRQPSLEARLLSVIPEDCHRQWFQQIWCLGGASTRQHPAPFPLALAERLVRMFSFVGDTVLDPFMGTGTTNLAAGKWGRCSIGFEIEPEYFEMACKRVKSLQEAQLTLDTLRLKGVRSPCVP
ncbi:MAG: Modification methylase MjaI [Methanosaeta sp. PtaU1.Bin060]|nr:MAG: Modification methylase MjaI [Methanosaeta sp. PtaU1.Bin060]